MTYVNEKLTVKAPAVKDKTIRAFPLRASLSAVLSAVVMCGLVLTYGIAATSGDNDFSYIAEAELESAENAETYNQNR